jgi:Uma2 family endonuclease
MRLDPKLLEPEQIRPLKRVEYDRLIDLGAFQDEKVELLYGTLVAMTPQGEAHALAVERLVTALYPLVQQRKARLRTQSPFAASDDSEPEPDLFLFPVDSTPGRPQRALLIVEVAFSSQHRDREIKSKLYAEAGVPEYWLVDLLHDRVEVRTEPDGGSYSTLKVFRDGETLRPLAFPDFIVPVNAILGPA